MKKYLIVLVTTLLLLTFNLEIVFATDVPFEVTKTKVTAETTVSVGSDTIAVDGILYDDAAIGEKFGYPPPKGEFDRRVKIPVESIHYKLEFWNVGKMGGEKGFIFKSSYEEAKLTIDYETGQAYKMVPTGESFMGLQAQEKKDVRTPNIDTMEYDLSFTGGPYGKFLYKNKEGSYLQIAYVEDGKYIHFEQFPEKRHLLYSEKATIQIDNSSAFEKWMEILGQSEGCSNPENPHKDSGIRFSDYNGEVMIRPCDDEDAWYGAELDMVLHKDDHIKTGDDSTCRLSLADMTTFVMKPESEIILSSPSEKENKIKLIWGKIKTNFKRMMEGDTMEVEMSQAVAGIKGTILITEETGNESTLKVIEGHVAFTSKTTGNTEMVGPGEMITATKEGLGKKKEFDIEKEDTTWASKEAMISDTQNKENNSNILLYVLIISTLAIVGFLYFKKTKANNNLL